MGLNGNPDPSPKLDPSLRFTLISNMYFKFIAVFLAKRPDHC